MTNYLTGALVLLLILAIACTKDAGLESQNNPNPQDTLHNDSIFPDQIIYRNTDSLEFHSVRSYTASQNTSCNPVPNPGDSTAFVEIDLDGDAVNDFRIQAHHNYDSKICGHCNRYIYNMRILPLSSENKISQDLYGVARTHNTGDTLNNSFQWHSFNSDFYLQGVCGGPSFDFTTAFLGIKMNNSYGYIKLSKTDNNGFKLLEYGFNKTPGNPIICGQK